MTTYSPDSITAETGARPVTETWRKHVAAAIGPRRVGGFYHCGSSGDLYEVLAIDPGPRRAWPSWLITVRTVGTTTVRSHCTAWDADRDRVVVQPQGELSAEWQAWVEQHPGGLEARAALLATEARHDVEEIDRPGEVTAFRMLAPGYAEALAKVAGSVSL